MKTLARIIALYLPQFHIIPENDTWWGQGFTEWTNATRAKPLFSGHYQPHIPAELGFYDLRLPEARASQAKLAQQYGIEAFCYYHYWFAGKHLLERPFDEVVASGEPHFPFCVCWANQSWTGIWHGAPDRILIEQTYPGIDDHRSHFEYLLPAFCDKRYVTVAGKPIFVIYKPFEIPKLRETMDLWQEMAIRAGLPGLYLIATLGQCKLSRFDPKDFGFDASVTPRLPKIRKDNFIQHKFNYIRSAIWKTKKLPTIYDHSEILKYMLPMEIKNGINFPCVVPNWDNTPRSGHNGLVLNNSTPELLRIQLKKSLDITCHLPVDQKIIFLKSWNEWAEGNHVEPDLQFGKAFLEVIRDEIVAPET
jgi:hypothetical protein